MGALASREQREEVRRSVKALLSAGRLVYGDPEHVDVVGASAERGAFLAPLLLEASDPGRPEPHQVEAFGPVSTIIGYRGHGRGDRASGAGPGQPGRIDRERSTRPLPATWSWAWHPGTAGRSCSTETTRPSRPAHGSPLPMLVHGGPGRAGGGEEMGGIRGVLHYMQRTAVQASPRVLSVITGRWTARARRGTPTAATRSASPSPNCGSATPWWRARAG